MNLDHIRSQLTIRSAFILFLLILISAIIQPFLVDQPAFFTYTGVTSSILSGLCFLFLYNSPPKHWHAYLLIAMGFFATLPLVLLSGGVHSQYALVLPIAPVIICMLTNARTGWLFTGLIILFVALLFFFQEHLPVLEGQMRFEGNGVNRGVWLALACLLGAMFGAEFDRMSRKLGSKLEDWDQKDPLTNVKNRSSIIDYLVDKIVQVKADELWLTVFKVDVDNLKTVNELNGHNMGDKCLQLVVETLKGCTRNREDAIGRFGSKDFMVVLESVDQSMAQKIAEKIRSNVEQLEIVSGLDSFGITVTIGYCSLPSEQIQSEGQMAGAAERALQAGKRAGKNQVVGAEHALVTQSNLGLENHYSEQEIIADEVMQ